MSKFKVLALSATLIMATAGLAIAGGDCASKASAETAQASGCASGAVTQTASAEGCASNAATAQTASAEGCASKAATAAAGGCASAATAQTVKLETVRMPSGSMAVFYNGTTPETVAYLQSKAAEGCSGFVCDMAKSMAADENVTTEIAATEHGVMILVTAKDSASLDKYEEQYAAVSKSMHEGE